MPLRMSLRMRPSQLFGTFVLNLLFVWPFQFIVWIIRTIISSIRDSRYDIDVSEYPDEDEWIDDNDNEQQIQDELSKYDNLPPMPEMSQIFPLENGGNIGVEYVSMCPDETAHIRIIGDTTFSQQYKRRVYRDKTYGQERYFKLNNIKYYLDDARTQPIAPTQAKNGK